METSKRRAKSQIFNTAAKKEVAKMENVGAAS